jgi:hypothetical protein
LEHAKERHLHHKKEIQVPDEADISRRIDRILKAKVNMRRMSNQASLTAEELLDTRQRLHKELSDAEPQNKKMDEILKKIEHREPITSSDIRELKEEQQQFSKKSAAREREFTTNMLKSLVGERLDEMRLSSDHAERFLQDPCWKHRLAAIVILREIWGVDERLAAACERMAFEDSHTQVRQSALSNLAQCFSGTDDRRIGILLAQVVSDQAESESFRATVYRGLFTLRDVPMLSRPFPFTERIPEDVDWPFVNSFVAEDS